MKDELRGRRSVPAIETLIQDARLAIGVLGRSPNYAVLAIVTLATGIAAVTAVDPSAVLGPVTTINDELSKFRAWRSFQTWPITVFGMLAVLPASLGTYGLLQQVFSQRKREIGIRIALGARAGQVRRLILRQALALVSTGLIVGILASLAMGRTLRSLLVAVTENDPVTLAATAVLLIGTATAAGYYPARKAAGVDPMVTLREE
jgi:putative ABC transport system permease protein